MTPFAEGYVEALRKSLPPEHQDAPLAPETLARILEDCERALADVLCNFQGTQAHGEQFWRERQSDQLNGWEPRFPPLHPYLAEDGLIYLREAV